MGLKDLKHRKTEQGSWKCTWGWGSEGATVEMDKLSLRISTGSNQNTLKLLLCGLNLD